MTSLADFAEAHKKVEPPKGWEPSITWNGREGTITTGPLVSEPDAALWALLIEDWGLDPTTTEVVDGTVQIRAWDNNLGRDPKTGDINVQRFRYYRATIRPRQARPDATDVAALCRLVEKRKPRVLVTSEESPQRAIVVALSDWQVGKGEGGGSEGTVERILSAIDATVAHIKGLRKLGRGPDAIYLIGMGDMIENCDGHYAMQAFQTDLDRRSQKRVVRRLILAFVEAMLQFNVPIVLGAVPGNHGENRRTGKAFTTFTDNDDLAVFDELAEVLAANPDRYSNVSVPRGAIAEDLTMTLDVAGVPVGFAHGHQMRSGGAGAVNKIETWFKGQALGRQPVANALILITGHLHHFVMSEGTGRTVIQCPAMDGGSEWWTSQTGANSPAGLMVVGVGQSYGPRGWGDLAVL